MDLLAVSAELHGEKTHSEKLTSEIIELKEQLEQRDGEIQRLQAELDRKLPFGVDGVLARGDKLKDLFKFYTGITFVRFAALLSFLIPGDYCMNYEKGRADIRNLSNQDALFLTLTRLRHDFGLKDLAFRFGLTVQSAGSLFNTWIDHMYTKLGQMSIWPHRDVIIRNMPAKYKKEFPTSLVIIDGTEVKTESPCALGLQSQMYSNYKSSTTLKCLIGCDPNGSVVFVSELFTGSISDKALTEMSGFYDVLRTLKASGYINDGDAVMADKGFTIEKELADIGLCLNIPPFVSATSQMSASDTALTQKIARHRVHIERVIAKVKTYQIVSNRIPTSLFKKINQIWSVCCLITLFQDVFVKDKK